MANLDHEDIDYSLTEATSSSPKKSKLEGPVGPWIECYLGQTPPTFEDCRDHFVSKGLKISEREYKTACKKMHKEPR